MHGSMPEAVRGRAEDGGLLRPTGARDGGGSCSRAVGSVRGHGRNPEAEGHGRRSPGRGTSLHGTPESSGARGYSGHSRKRPWLGAESLETCAGSRGRVAEPTLDSGTWKLVEAGDADPTPWSPNDGCREGVGVGPKALPAAWEVGAESGDWDNHPEAAWREQEAGVWTRYAPELGSWRREQGWSCPWNSEAAGGWIRELLEAAGTRRRSRGNGLKTKPSSSFSDIGSGPVWSREKAGWLGRSWEMGLRESSSLGADRCRDGSEAPGSRRRGWSQESHDGVGLVAELGLDIRVENQLCYGPFSQ